QGLICCGRSAGACFLPAGPAFLVPRALLQRVRFLMMARDAAGAAQLEANETKMNILNKGLAAVATAVAIAAMPAVALGQDGPLVTADWLLDNLGDPNVRVFE